MDVEITKQLEGQKVYLLPMGNCARRGGPKLYEATVEKVNRVNAVVRIGDMPSRKFRFKSDYFNDGFNGGYKVFSTRQEIDDLLFVKEAASKISEKYRYAREFEKLSKDKIIEVAEILSVDLQDLTKQ